MGATLGSELGDLDSNAYANANALRITPEMLRDESRAIQKAINEAILDRMPETVQALEAFLTWEIRDREINYRRHVTSELMDKANETWLREFKVVRPFEALLADIDKDLRTREQTTLWVRFLRRHDFRLRAEHASLLSDSVNDRGVRLDTDADALREQLKLGLRVLHAQDAMESGYSSNKPESGKLRIASEFEASIASLESIVNAYNQHLDGLLMMVDALREWRARDYHPEYLHEASRKSELPLERPQASVRTLVPL